MAKYYEAYHRSMILGDLRCGHKHPSKKKAQACATKLNKTALLHYGVRARG